MLKRIAAAAAGAVLMAAATTVGAEASVAPGSGPDFECAVWLPCSTVVRLVCSVDPKLTLCHAM